MSFAILFKRVLQESYICLKVVDLDIHRGTETAVVQKTEKVFYYRLYMDQPEIAEELGPCQH